MKQVGLIISFLLSFSMVYAQNSTGNLSNTKLQLQLKQNIESLNFQSGLSTLDANLKFSQGNYRLVYYMEKGALLHYAGKYTESNAWLNKADFYIEDYKKKTGEVVLTYLSNPNSADYPGEDFEALFINYYKALNYLALNQLEEALVEAKRMNILLNWFNDKYPDNKYDKDAFIHLMMGLIYDANKQYNDACIAYVNAFEVYESDYMKDYNLGRPTQLIDDIVRTAKQAGLTDDYERFKGMSIRDEIPDWKKKGSALVLWHNGLSPKKVEENIVFKVTNVGGYVSFQDNSNNENYKYASAAIGSLGAINSIINNQSGIYKMSFSKYVARKPVYTRATLSVAGTDKKKTLEICEDLNAIAFQSHKDRKAREFSNALARLVVREAAKTATKKVAGKAASSLANHFLGGAAGKLAGTAAKIGAEAAIDAAGNALEKADLRQWSSLPHSIYYTRIYLDEGNHNLHFKAEGSKIHEQDISTDIKPGASKFFVVKTLEHNGLVLVNKSPELAKLEIEKTKTLQSKALFFSSVPPGKWPSSTDKITSRAIYYIAYYHNEDNVYVSNVFKVNGYSGGFWPFKNDVLKEIDESQEPHFKLIGFHESQADALAKKAQLEQKAKNAKLNLNAFKVKSEFGFATSDNNSAFDPWSTSHEETNESSSSAFDDVWSNDGGGNKEKKAEPVKTGTSSFDDPW